MDSVGAASRAPFIISGPLSTSHSSTPTSSGGAALGCWSEECRACLEVGILLLSQRVVGHSMQAQLSLGHLRCSSHSRLPCGMGRSCPHRPLSEGPQALSCFPIPLPMSPKSLINGLLQIHASLSASGQPI